jgi:hypothetical protein
LSEERADAGDVLVAVGAREQQPLDREGVHESHENCADVYWVGGRVEVAGGLPTPDDLGVQLAGAPERLRSSASVTRPVHCTS